MAGKAGTRIESGKTEVVTSGTPVQLIAPVKSPSYQSTAIGVWVSADVGNTESVVVGDKNVKAKTKENNGVVLPKQPSAAQFIEVEDVTSLWVDAQKEKEFVSWLVIYR